MGDLVERICEVFNVKDPVRNSFCVVVAGTRTFGNYELLRDKLDSFLEQKSKEFEIVIISGCAKGADTLGERYAEERGYKVERFEADWDQHSKKAGPIRNGKMADAAQAVVIFWDGVSRGSMNMRQQARDRNLPVRVVRYCSRFVDHGCGFPVTFIDVPMVNTRGVWTPDVNYRLLHICVLDKLADLDGELSDVHDNFFRLVLNMSVEQFEKKYGHMGDYEMKREIREFVGESDICYNVEID